MQRTRSIHSKPSRSLRAATRSPLVPTRKEAAAEAKRNAAQAAAERSKQQQEAAAEAKSKAQEQALERNKQQAAAAAEAKEKAAQAAAAKKAADEKRKEAQEHKPPQ